MIGVPELDKLTEEQMIAVIKGELRVAVRDPKKLQTSVEDIPEPCLTNGLFMEHDKVITLLKMELEQRLGLIYLRELLDEQELQ
jgi:hypothetical protein